MRRKLFVFLICFGLLTAFLAMSGVAEEAEGELLSPGLRVIAARCEMVVSGVPGGEVIFTEDDFIRAVGYEPDEITITSRPDSAVGQLTLGSVLIPEGQTLSGSNLDRISFMPSGNPDADTACFSFSADGAPYDYTCFVRLMSRGAVNNAPTLDCATAASLSAKVPEGGICGGRLAASDPDGDGLVFEIVSYPKHGSVMLSDRETGRYLYRPTAGYTGKDRFVYTVRDEWGNYAGEAEVRVTVSRFSTPEFADMSGSAETFARIVTSEGLMSGTLVGGEEYFYPERGVTRSEFTVNLLIAAGIEVGENAVTVFSDNDDIPVSARPYISMAYELGLSDGWIRGGEQIFLPNEEISLAEAALMTSRLLGIGYDSAVMVSAPLGEASWAKREIAALCSAGFAIENVGVTSNTLLDRASAAELLCGVLNIANDGGVRK